MQRMALPHAMLSAPATSPATPDSCMVRKSLLAAPTPAERAGMHGVPVNPCCMFMMSVNPMHTAARAAIKSLTSQDTAIEALCEWNTAPLRMDCHRCSRAMHSEPHGCCPDHSPSIREATETSPSLAPSTKARTAAPHTCRGNQPLPHVGQTPSACPAATARGAATVPLWETLTPGCPVGVMCVAAGL